MPYHQKSTVGRLIRDLRKKHRISQRQLALRMGTQQSAISRIEHDEISPTVETLTQLLTVMGEDLEMRPRRRDAGVDPVHMAAELKMTPTQRLEQAFAWMEFNSELAGKATSATEPKVVDA